jgi:hypothetical protein
MCSLGASCRSVEIDLRRRAFITSRGAGAAILPGVFLLFFVESRCAMGVRSWGQFRRGTGNADNAPAPLTAHPTYEGGPA